MDEYERYRINAKREQIIEFLKIDKPPLLGGDEPKKPKNRTFGYKQILSRFGLKT